MYKQKVLFYFIIILFTVLNIFLIHIMKTLKKQRRITFFRYSYASSLLLFSHIIQFSIPMDVLLHIHDDNGHIVAYTFHAFADVAHK